MGGYGRRRSKFRSSHPNHATRRIEQQSKEDLKSLGRRLRQAHSRAHDISMRQQREMRGKAEPHGAHPATDATGSIAKTQALFEAIQRVDRELSRREEIETGKPSPEGTAS